MYTSEQTNATRSLKALYISTVFVVTTLTLIGQAITQRSLHNQSKDSHIVNIAGRQRMLSQQISKSALALQITDGSTYQQRLQELREAVELWSRSHEGLIKGDAELGLPSDNSFQIAAMYAEIDPHYQAVLEAARAALSVQGDEQEQILPLLDDILANEAAFLKGMNAIVLQYDEEAQTKVERLKRTQWILLTITLLVLLPLFIPIQTMTRKVNVLIQQMQQSSIQVNALIQQMQQSGIQVTSSSTEIAASGKQLETMMTEQVASTHQVTGSAQEIASTVATLATTMEQVSQRAHATAQAANNGQQGLTQMENTLQQLSEATQSISAKLGIISERAHSINNIVTTITKVADQTNLLSLNAAIEAEKAGEAGAGFAVVAREIRRLADQTAVATLEIEATVQDMQSAVANGVMEMDKFTQEVSHGVGDIRQISQQVT
nr:methyl-accepting chemotaxis protein [Leptolyngbyaceae cyanobacterium MO_188.B28]